MSYLQFHLVFTAPVLIGLGLLQGRTRGSWTPLAVIATIAFVYTTPWDNYLVAQGVWTYPPGAVLATVGHVPVEEYAFFVIQTAMTGLWVRLLQARDLAPRPSDGSQARWVGTALFATLSVLGVALAIRGGHGLYLGLILGWAGPVLTLMWGLAGHLLWARRRLLAGAVVPTTLYLWVADRVAIGLGIWDITDATRTGVDLVGLPVEEALFFVVTNLMVAQGLMLLERDALRQTVGRWIPAVA